MLRDVAPRVRIRAAIPYVCIRTFSWRGIQLSAGTALPLVVRDNVGLV
jgi:hypothetical protein